MSEQFQIIVMSGKRPLEVCDLKQFQGISIEDRLRILLDPEVVGEKVIRLFECDLTERYLRRLGKFGYEPPVEWWEAIETSRRFATGKATLSELRSANAASNQARKSAKSDQWDAWVAAHDAEYRYREESEESDNRWRIKRLAHYLRQEHDPT